MGLADSAIAILEPFIGRAVAETWVRAAALSAGKSRDELSADDIPLLSGKIRRLLASVAPRTTVDAIVLEIERSAR